MDGDRGEPVGRGPLLGTALVIPLSSRGRTVAALTGFDPLPSTSAAALESNLRSMRDRVFLESRGHALSLTASIGVVTLPKVTGSAEELLRAADMAMYRVKAGGKDGIHVTEER